MLFNHQQKNSNGGGTANSTAAADTSFLEHTISRGTLKDKIAAMSVLISTYPIHKLYILDSLLSMVGCQSHSTNPTNAHSNGNHKRSMSHSTSQPAAVNWLPWEFKQNFEIMLRPSTGHPNGDGHGDAQDEWRHQVLECNDLCEAFLGRTAGQFYHDHNVVCGRAQKDNHKDKVKSAINVVGDVPHIGL